MRMTTHRVFSVLDTAHDTIMALTTSDHSDHHQNHQLQSTHGVVHTLIPSQTRCTLAIRAHSGSDPKFSDLEVSWHGVT